MNDIGRFIGGFLACMLVLCLCPVILLGLVCGAAVFAFRFGYNVGGGGLANLFTRDELRSNRR